MNDAGTIFGWVQLIALVAGGGFALFKWRDQLRERRYEQYWKLITNSQQSTFIAEQKIALLLLKRYPEFRFETIEFLKDANSRPTDGQRIIVLRSSLY